ncbi:TetR/AcrR family transcriptional regulator [Sulfitobacter geojensis]|uniref:TetR/AcrR family transcriptional regulator n=1 Tax=Sulfitobacter geojensis TaxID=1342299 RepID=UPI003B8D3A6C
MNIHYSNGSDLKRLTPEATQAKIRTALVEEVAKQGIGATSVGAVAKRAGMSAGTIYLHFENKEDMLRKVFLQIKTDIHTLMMSSADDPDAKSMIRKMWFDLFGFVAAHPMDFMFVEYAGAAQILSKKQARKVADMQVEIAALIQRGIDEGAIVGMPVSMVTTLLIAPAMQLARAGVLASEQPSEETLGLVFERVWLSVAAKPSFGNLPD